MYKVNIVGFMQFRYFKVDWIIKLNEINFFLRIIFKCVYNEKV